MNIQPTKVIINTDHGDADATVQRSEAEGVIVHCFMPPCGGAGLFLGFRNTVDIADAIAGMRQVINLGPYEPNKNLSAHFNIKGCQIVGSGESVTDKIKSGEALPSPLKGLL